MYHIIINPASRSGRGAKIWAEQVEPALKAGNTEYQTYFPGKPEKSDSWPHRSPQSMLQSLT